MKERMVAAVDVGSSKICSLLANVTTDGSIQIVGIGTARSRGITKGLVAEIDQASEAVQEAVRKAERSSGENIASVYVGISGSAISSQGSRGTVSVGRNARPVRSQDVNRAIRCARDVDLGEEERLLHVIPTQYTLDSQIGVKDPVGLHGFRLDVDTHIVTIPESSAENLIKCVRKAGLAIDGLVLQCLASSQAVLHPDEIDAGVVLVDIGAGISGMAAYKNSNLELTAVLPVGGNQITRDLSIGLGIPFEVAEQIKREHCNLVPDESDEKEETAISVNFDGGLKVSKRDVDDIVRARVVETMKLLISQFLTPHGSSYRNYVAEFPAGLVLTGGTANLGGIRYVAQEVTGLPTRIGVPTSLSGLADRLRDAAYASSVGILLCGGKRWGREQNWRREGLRDKVVDKLKALQAHTPWRRG